MSNNTVIYVENTKDPIDVIIIQNLEGDITEDHFVIAEVMLIGCSDGTLLEYDRMSKLKLKILQKGSLIEKLTNEKDEPCTVHFKGVVSWALVSELY